MFNPDPTYQKEKCVEQYAAAGRILWAGKNSNPIYRDDLIRRQEHYCDFYWSLSSFQKTINDLFNIKK